MSTDAARKALAEELRALGGSVAPPAAAERADAIADAVMARIARAPAGDQRRTPASRLRDAVARRRRALVALVLAGLVALVAAPPVRAAVAEWFGFGGVRVRIQPLPVPSTAPPPPSVTGSETLAEARSALGFDPIVPAALGRPDAVEVSADRRRVSMTWSGGRDGRVRLDQWAADLDGLFLKTAPHASYPTVRGSFAVWFDGPHEVVLLEPGGGTRAEPPRLAGRTLIWQSGRATLRLEGDLTQQRAVAIAESSTAAA
jgi:hypothetical protein